MKKVIPWVRFLLFMVMIGCLWCVAMMGRAISQVDKPTHTESLHTILSVEKRKIYRAVDLYWVEDAEVASLPDSVRVRYFEGEKVIVDGMYHLSQPQ